jgi:tetratricopeptide (TPR) repeat protein
MSSSASKTSPVVVSFYCGDSYYYEAAETLRQDCARLGLDSDIVELQKRPEEGWLQICRRKIPFYLQMHRKHDRPILWLDVDSRLMQYPTVLNGATCDFAAFLRGVRQLRHFDPVAVSRFFMPFALFFNATAKMRAFLEFMAKLEQESAASATDDFFLQEAWEKFEEQLSVMVLPPDLARLPDWPITPSQVFYYGGSGNVKEFKGKAQQHEVQLQTPARRKAVLLHEASIAAKAKNPKDALFLYRKALEADPSDAALADKIARIMRRDGKLANALIFLRRYQGASFTVNYARRFLADSELEAGKIERAAAITRDLLVRGTDSDKAWAASRLVRIGLEERAAAMKLRPEQRPAMWWMEGPYPGNFGDILNPYIVEKLSGKPPRYVPRGKGLLAIGSIIKFAAEGTPVWGSGTPRMTDKLNPKAKYHAVRGPLTRELVLTSGGQCPEVFGDAAWFLPRLYQPKTPAKRFKLGLIRHYANDNELFASDDVKVISVMRAGYDGIEQFIDEIAECEAILTTSLHGLIVSHAYGIPARWCEVPDSEHALPGDGTKFHDYMLSVGITPEAPLHLPRNTVVTLAYAPEAQRLPKRQIDLHALAAAAPFEITADWERGCVSEPHRAVAGG